MAYQSLYRKYRPQSFDDIVGQVPVVRTLVNAITEDRLHHAYLFAGPRGTGKTSTARILAKAINCEQGPTATPCGTCQMCVDITAGSAVDVVELDMASHGSVDDARELRERALFAPAQARRKVYILDEVHMASPQAFNALLKLIEEPPAHVLFTMATTDPQKVLTTILSRVQRLDLRRVGAADVAGHVTRIAQAEGRQLDEAAVDAVVRAGDGSVRDTMSILEQVLAYGSGTITGDQVGEVLGTTPADVTYRAAQHVIDRDLAGVLTLVQDLLDSGKDLRRFALDLVGHLRDLLVLQVAPDRPDLLDTTDAHREALAKQAPQIARETLIRALRLLADALPEMRQGPPRLPLELALSRAALPEVAGDVGALADRIARLESGAAAPGPRGAAGSQGAGGAAAQGPTGREAAAAAAAAASGRAPATPAATPEDAPETPQDAPDTPAPATVTADEAPVQADPATVDPGPGGPSTGQETPSPDAADAGDSGADAGAEPAEAAEAAPEDEEAAADDEPEPLAPVETAPPTVTTRGLGEEPPTQRSTEPTPADTAPATRQDDTEPNPRPAAPDGAADAATDSAATTAHAGGVSGDLFEQIRTRWPAILERVRDASRRAEAIFSVSSPVSLVNGTLTLGFAPQHANFHAKQAPTGDLARTLQDAIEHVCGQRPGSVGSTVLEDAELPPAPDDVATSASTVADAPAEAGEAEEELAVAEAEAAAATDPDPGDDEEAAAAAADLITRELDAEPVDS